jgi:hypothetical protein
MFGLEKNVGNVVKQQMSYGVLAARGAFLGSVVVVT